MATFWTTIYLEKCVVSASFCAKAALFFPFLRGGGEPKGINTSYLIVCKNKNIFKMIEHVKKAFFV